ncbi:MAG: response regulator transcription factor [bacterium]
MNKYSGHSMKPYILIIDDDEKLNLRLSKYLIKQFGFTVDTASHPAEGMQKLTENQFDLLILDVMMPDTDGFEVLRKVRQQQEIPIIMLTARGDVTDRIVGLELGADDYVPKPFEPRELVARIQTVLRRYSGEKKTKSTSKQVFGDLEVNFDTRSIKIKQKPVSLTHLEFEILSLFIKNKGIVLDRDYLLDQLRGLDWDAYNRSIDVLISRLRQKLQENPKHPKYIKTVWGTGYIFIGHKNEK